MIYKPIGPISPIRPIGPINCGKGMCPKYRLDAGVENAAS